MRLLPGAGRAGLCLSRRAARGRAAFAVGRDVRGEVEMLENTPWWYIST